MSGTSQIAGPLSSGLDVIDDGQLVTFIKYNLFVLPLDGFVFWVRADLLDPYSQEYQFSGSVHYSTNSEVNEDETIDMNRVTFTTTQEVQPFNGVDGTTLFIANFDGIRFAFNRRDPYYRQSGLYHYGGNALYPAMKSQIIDDLSQFDKVSVVVSNSLPIWLSMVQSSGLPWLQGIGVPFYPSFLIADNIPPPYVAVHIEPSSTQGLQQTPFFDNTSSQWQLVKERVVLTCYGLRNQQVADLLFYVNLHSRDVDGFGIFNAPVPRDEKRTENDFGILAMKKTIEFEITYNQQAARNIARQLILSCLPTFILG